MEFPPPHIQPSKTSQHTHTVILLHGRGSDGEEFAEDFLSSTTSSGKNLASCLPSYRWVFATSRVRWTTRFEEEMCSWFDAYSLDDIQVRQELQKDGLKESVLKIVDIIESEANLLDGRTSNIYLGGISQGMATALWAFFAAIGLGKIQEPLGGLLVFCGWLPFAQQLEALLAERAVNASQICPIQHEISSFFFSEISGDEKFQVAHSPESSMLSTPVFLSHGTDDAWVSVELGRQASQILHNIMTDVEWHEFTGAEGDGHWVKEPEGFDQILPFLGPRHRKRLPGDVSPVDNSQQLQ